MSDDQARLWRELRSLQDELSEAKDEIAALRKGRQPKPLDQEPAVGPASTLNGEPTDELVPLSSRRSLLKKAGLGAAVTAAGVVAAAKPAAAADGDPILLGSETNEATTATVAIGNGGPNRNAFTFEDAANIYGSGSTHPSSLAAYSASPSTPNAFFAYSESNAATSNLTGHAVVAWAASGSRSNILLRSELGDPRNSVINHREGELIFDRDENLWLCVDTGTPGVWRKVAGPDTSGSFHPISAKRVWDTRFQGGAMGFQESRTVSVADGRPLSSASVDVPDLVPQGATAVMVTMAITGTGAAGFMAVTPGGTAHTASSINWYENNTTLANTTVTPVNSNREVTVFCSGTGHFILDINGYYL